VGYPQPSGSLPAWAPMASTGHRVRPPLAPVPWNRPEVRGSRQMSRRCQSAKLQGSQGFTLTNSHRRCGQPIAAKFRAHPYYAPFEVWT